MDRTTLKVVISTGILSNSGKNLDGEKTKVSIFALLLK